MVASRVLLGDGPLDVYFMLERNPPMIIRCPDCNFTATVKDQSLLTPDHPPVCPRCRTDMTLPDQKDPAAVQPYVQDVFQRLEVQRVPWQDRFSWLDLGAFWRTSLNILFHPSATFAAIDYSAGIRSSLVYLLVYGSLGQIIGRYWFALIGIQYGILEGNALANTMWFARAALFTPFLLLIFISFTAGLAHLILRLLFAAQKPFSATFQVMAYASGATSLLNAIPFVGSFLMPIWTIVLYCIGLSEAHQTSKIKSFIALLLPVILVGSVIAAAVLLLAVMGVMEFLDPILQYL